MHKYVGPSRWGGPIIFFAGKLLMLVGTVVVVSVAVAV